MDGTDRLYVFSKYRAALGDRINYHNDAITKVVVMPDRAPKRRFAEVDNGNYVGKSLATGVRDAAGRVQEVYSA